MPISIYNSLTRKKEEFKPLKPQEVKMYVCGPTVYDEPHIGHARSAYIFDVIRRYLRYRGYEVKFVRNVTDVDDKIIEKAKKEYPNEDLNVSFQKVAQKYLASYHQALKNLGIDDSGIIQPKASEYIAKMVSFINDLIAKGAAYTSAGDVYFDIKKAKDYGKLSNQSLEKMESGARVIKGDNKRDPLDFALWKSAQVGEPSWASPYGKGRPGWHIECSVMSSDILGDTFDIHGGGLDLIFPHHENEIAQSEAAGKSFAKYWIHHGLLTINGQKMAKSLGNFITIEDFLAKYKNPDLLKLFFLSAHYSSPVDYTDEKISESRQALERIMIFVNKIDGEGHKATSQGAVVCPPIGKATRYKFEEIDKFKNKFVEAMDDDFNTPQALASIFELVNAANKKLEDEKFTIAANCAIVELLSILGISLKEVKNESGISDNEVETMIAQRNDARKNKDYALSDKIRRELEAKGIILEDTKDGKTTWRRKL
ncbi:MAG: cysteine--tRNA ligase [Candidatus Omnitrophica bacterium]|nr:cysteine--tRNA ligase [Candidatus Omnitrophota bacterium]